MTITKRAKRVIHFIAAVIPVTVFVLLVNFVLPRPINLVLFILFCGLLALFDAFQRNWLMEISWALLVSGAILEYLDPASRVASGLYALGGIWFLILHSYRFGLSKGVARAKASMSNVHAETLPAEVVRSEVQEALRRAGVTRG